VPRLPQVSPFDATRGGLEVPQHKTDLQTGESEGGSPVPPAVVKPPS